MMTDPIFIIVDLFCGAGGTTTGFVQAEIEGTGVAKVIACVNHDPKAIKSHWRNHPEVKHFEEDIRTLDLSELVSLVRFYRRKYPSAMLILWASLECTNFSKAKGGQPRDADSRTLADHLDRYIIALDPEYVQIENVVEFMSWGPLNEHGKPVSRKNGQDWLRWRNMISEHGYTNDWKELNSANYGAYTSRNRLFGVFAKEGLPIAWPEPSHAKKPSTFSMHGDLKKWKAVKDVLNFEDEGQSIFTRKKPLSDKTLERIYAGLVKYVAKGDTSFISKYYSGKPSGKNISTDGPAGTVTCVDGQALVQSQFLVKYNSMDKDGNYYPPDMESPAPVVTTQNRLYLASPQFLAAHYSNGHNISSVDSPCPTISTKDRFQFIQPEFIINYNHSSKTNDINEPAPTIMAADKLAIAQPEFFIDKHYGNNAQNQSIEDPAGVIMPNDKHRLVEAVPFLMPTSYDNKPKSVDEPAPTIQATRRHHYIVNPSHGGHCTSTDAPCPVIVARQDKAPLYMVLVEGGQVAIEVYEGDSEIMIKIKQFMAAFGLVDIKMRMLRVPELLSIQGFPSGYKLEGNQSDQKKFIGNSVVPQVVKAWTEAMAMRIIDERKNKVA
jgi:DNA (cytosine-5)-methyltransferase 1